MVRVTTPLHLREGDLHETSAVMIAGVPPPPPDAAIVLVMSSKVSCQSVLHPGSHIH